MSLRLPAVIFLLFSGMSNVAGAQSLHNMEMGLPYFVERYSHEVYGAHHQNWAVTQDNRGVIYVGNSRGVLEYDGGEWRLITLPYELPARSLDTDELGRVYIGSFQEFGYLEPDSAGSMSFVSLLPKVPESARDFVDIWSVHATREGVFFQSHDYLFRLSAGRIDVFSFDDIIYNAFRVRGKLFLHVNNRGLVRFSEGRLFDLPHGDQFGTERVFALMPFGRDGFFIATRTRGLSVLENGKLRDLDSEVGTYLSENRLYHGSAIDSSTYALATLQAGVVVVDTAGNLVRVINERSGLLDQMATYVFPDLEGGLWIALNNGLTRIDALSPVSVYDRRTRLDGALSHMTRHQGRLYVATNRGVHSLHHVAHDSHGAQPGAEFRPVAGLNSTSWHLQSTDQGLLTATDDGIFLLQNGAVTPVRSGRAYVLSVSRTNPDLVFAGTQDGLVRLIRQENRWVDGGNIEGVEEEIRAIVEDDEGDIWLAPYRGILRMRKDANDSYRITRYRSDDGLPDGFILIVPRSDGPSFVSEQGIYRFDQSRHRFVMDTTLIAAEHISDVGFIEVSSGEIWLSNDGRVEVLTPLPEGGYRRRAIPVLTFREMTIRDFFVEPDGVVWIGGEDRLIRYDSNIDPQQRTTYPALIRKVVVNNDSLLFGGAFRDAAGRITTTQAAAAHPVLTHKHNALRFSYAATSFVTEGATEFQYLLEGFDRTWSHWTNEIRKDYTNLPRGDYHFRVRAKNRYGFESEEAVFAFSILPPWYQTWWAYTLYILGLIGVILGYGRYRSLLHAAEMQRELAKERLVNERLQQANALLQEADKLKDEFLANTSHELRTPLAAILGFASVLREEVADEHREFVELIEQSGDRLLHTLNSLLDLAKLRANMMEIKPEPIDVVTEVRTAVRLLKPLAAKKRLYLKVDADAPEAYAVLDRVCLERVLNNLVGNAIKFTEDGGVSVQITTDGHHVSLLVEDTGVGIDRAFLPFLFDEFRQQSSGLARSHEGSGLGLSITKRMVDLMNGTISVTSEEGRGTAFTVTFPAASESASLAAAESAQRVDELQPVLTER